MFANICGKRDWAPKSPCLLWKVSSMELVTHPIKSRFPYSFKQAVHFNSRVRLDKRRYESLCYINCNCITCNKHFLSWAFMRCSFMIFARSPYIAIPIPLWSERRDSAQSTAQSKNCTDSLRRAHDSNSDSQLPPCFALLGRSSFPAARCWWHTGRIR